MDYAAIAPEITSLQIYSGPGSAPLRSVSAAWQRQDAEIKRLADAYDAVAEDYSELTARVDALDEKLTEMTRRFWSAIAYVRQLTAVIRRIDPDHNIPDPPDDLEAYL